MTKDEKILEAIGEKKVRRWLAKIDTPQSVAGQRVGAKPGSRKAQLKEHFNRTFIIKKP